jgi:hypothetical protein
MGFSWSAGGTNARSQETRRSAVFARGTSADFWVARKFSTLPADEASPHGGCHHDIPECQDDTPDRPPILQKLP